MGRKMGTAPIAECKLYRKNVDKMCEKYNEIYTRPIVMKLAEDNRKIWMALLHRNGICEIDKETKQGRILRTFEKESLAEEELYWDVEKVGHYLVFAPGAAEEIAIYNLENMSIRYIPLKKADFACKERQDNGKFWNIVRYYSNVYLIGYAYPAIVKINMESMKVTYIADWVETLERETPERDTGGYFSDGYVIDGDSLLLPISHMQAVLELNLKWDHTSIRKLNISAEGVGGISSADRENIWLVGRGHGSDHVFCWNRKINEIKSFLLSEENENIFYPFYAPLCTESKVFLMPILAANSYEIHSDGKLIKKSEEMGIQSENVRVSLWTGSTMAPRLQGNQLVYLTCRDLKWHEYNVATGEHSSFHVHLKEDIWETEQYLEAQYQKKKNVFFSELRMPLRFFLDRMLNIEKRSEDEVKVLGLNGKKIYDQIYREI